MLDKTVEHIYKNIENPAAALRLMAEVRGSLSTLAICYGIPSKLVLPEETLDFTSSTVEVP